MKYLSIFRKRLGYTQKELCKFLEIDRPYYAKIESGKRSPGKKLKNKLELFFGERWEFLNSDKKNDYENNS